ncbi:MAG: GtrA family protein [Lachnospira sp.]|jgi:putative flippase GtrA|nr:GtrA family protein [Lachnospira sp.]
MKLLNKANIKQFISYFFVGGVAAIVEWVMFFIFANVLQINYFVSTVIAFIFSTTANWILGRITTFKDNNTYKDKKAKEAFLVFIVSAIGLLFNLILMYLFVTVMGFDSSLGKTLSKIAATGIVFIWNFLIRKLVIYR